MSFVPILFTLALLLFQVQGTCVMLSTRLCSAYLSKKLFHPKQGETHTTDQYWYSARHSGGTYARVFAKALNNMKLVKNTCEVYEQPTGTALIVNSETNYGSNWELFLDTAFKDAKLQKFNQAEVVGIEIFGAVGSETFPTNYAVMFFTTTTRLRFLKKLHKQLKFKLSIPAIVQGVKCQRRFFNTEEVLNSNFLFSSFLLNIPINLANNEPLRRTVHNTSTGNLCPKKSNAATGRRRVEDFDNLLVEYVMEILEEIKKKVNVSNSGTSSNPASRASSVQSTTSPSPENVNIKSPSLGVVYWEHEGVLHVRVIVDKKNGDSYDLDSLTTGGILEAALSKLGKKKWTSGANANFANKKLYPASNFASFQATECLHSAELLSNQNFYYIPGIVVAIRSITRLNRPLDSTMMLEMLNGLFNPSDMIDVNSVPIFGAGVDFFEDLYTAAAYMAVVIIRESTLLTYIYSLDPSILISTKAVRVAVEAYCRFEGKTINNNVTTIDLPIFTVSSNQSTKDESSIYEAMVLAQEELLFAKRGNIDKKGQLIAFDEQLNSEDADVTAWKGYAFSVWFVESNKLILAKIFDDVAQHFETLEVITKKGKK